jgi:hypothetical protein
MRPRNAGAVSEPNVERPTSTSSGLERYVSAFSWMRVLPFSSTRISSRSCFDSVSVSSRVLGLSRGNRAPSETTSVCCLD